MDNFNSLIYFQFNVCTGKKEDLELFVELQFDLNVFL